ncbi:hypothetical protein [Hymenobacter persicinus]|uniref:Glycosyltransferase RgtA/B/C/D-like domain-containing protein n=1 Tax=Hymenobacter persicinus TaxID=2025506 RepID=A0A4Q5L843_9BACT|nr:hypothetical protein [Hymenobacter persicinus]RYU77775.1 hypothetical protein EWM57_16735 [Hymenobacter persicinus]
MSSFRLSYHGRFLLGAAVLLIAAVGAIAYLVSSYAALQSWYLGLNSCFYRVESWPTQFFTPAVKAQGNLLCALALGLCTLGLAYLAYRWRQAPTAPLAAPPSWLRRADALYLLPVLATASGLWWWGQAAVVPGTDEVFSALYCARLPAFQTVAYYMLPNNHLLFNLLNGGLFGGADNLVATGRLLSGVAYLVTVAAAYGWFRQLTEHRLLAALVALTVALQFPLWGFGFQARGYALYALAHWGAFIGLFGYLQYRRGGWLLLNAVSCAAGYAVVPTFLYFHLGQLAFGVVYQLLRRELDWRFWRYQAAALVAVFLFYLPALSFSGLAALTSNEYVRPKSATLGGFLPSFGQDLQGYVTYCFSRVKVLGVQLSYVLALLPLLLRAKRNTIWFAYGLFYALLLLVLVLLMIGMRRSTNQRNLIGHCSLAQALVPATLYWLLSRLPAHWRAARWQLGVTAGLLLILGLKFAKTNPIAKAEDLYLFDNTTAYRAIEDGVQTIPAGRSVAFSWESFNAYHAARQRGLRCSLPCEPASADYYVVYGREKLPVALASQYELASTFPKHRIYRRR